MKKIIAITFGLLMIYFSGLSQEIGMQLYSVRNEIKKDLEGTLRQVRSMGIKELEGGELYGMDLKSYKKMLDQIYKSIDVDIDNFFLLNGCLAILN